jgi:hypothetical protein
LENVGNVLDVLDQRKASKSCPQRMLLALALLKDCQDWDENDDMQLAPLFDKLFTDSFQLVLMPSHTANAA